MKAHPRSRLNLSKFTHGTYNGTRFRASISRYLLALAPACSTLRTSFTYIPASPSPPPYSRRAPSFPNPTHTPSIPHLSSQPPRLPPPEAMWGGGGMEGGKGSYQRSRSHPLFSRPSPSFLRLAHLPHFLSSLGGTILIAGRWSRGRGAV